MLKEDVDRTRRVGIPKLKWRDGVAEVYCEFSIGEQWRAQDRVVWVSGRPRLTAGCSVTLIVVAVIF